jgi:elongation factor G
MPDRPLSAPRTVALVGPYLSGKTTLMENLLFAAGSLTRKGSVKEANTVGDHAAEARARRMSTEVTAAQCQYLGETWTILDCPGSVELAHEAQSAVLAADVAVVVCEPAIEKALMVAPLLKFLDDRAVPHILFVNKMDTASARVAEVVDALQAVSQRPLVVRQVPIREGDAITGYIDLVSERAYAYKPGQPSQVIQIPAGMMEREKAARTELLEALADFDDHLLEQLLEDMVPSRDEVYGQLKSDLHKDLIVPVLLGAAEKGAGVARLWKALRHDAPEPAETARRLGFDPAKGGTLASVFKTFHLPHTGKLTLARVWRGQVQDGMTLDGGRVGGVFRPFGHELTKRPAAVAGEVVGLGRLESARTGDLLKSDGEDAKSPWPKPPSPLFSLAIVAENRADEVKLTTALAKLVDEDPSLAVEHSMDTNQILLLGQGEIHLQIALDRLRGKYNLPIKATRPQVPYKETIRHSVKQHARHKRQSGGHGQFGDVHVEIRPLPRGQGFEFEDAVVGGSIPRNFIPSVEEGVNDYLRRGPLGFPVVDIAVKLYDGQYHSVDSSDMAFKTAGRLAMSEGMPKCAPVLLEPIHLVQIAVPNEFTSRVHGLISGRRGQILGYDAKPGWPGWDEVNAHIPQAELHDLIIELRSLTLGVGTFSMKFDHLQELTGRLADKVIEQRASAVAQ